MKEIVYQYGYIYVHMCLFDITQYKWGKKRKEKKNAEILFMYGISAYIFSFMITKTEFLLFAYFAFIG